MSPLIYFGVPGVLALAEVAMVTFAVVTSRRPLSDIDRRCARVDEELDAATQRHHNGFNAGPTA